MVIDLDNEKKTEEQLVAAAEQLSQQQLATAEQLSSQLLRNRSSGKRLQQLNLFNLG